MLNRNVGAFADCDSNFFLDIGNPLDRRANQHGMIANNFVFHGIVIGIIRSRHFFRRGPEAVAAVGLPGSQIIRLRDLWPNPKNIFSIAEAVRQKARPDARGNHKLGLAIRNYEGLNSLEYLLFDHCYESTALE